MEAEIMPCEKMLPEMWMEIFSELPAKILVKLRCVCKTWRYILDNPSFIAMHIARFKNNSINHFLISFEKSIYELIFIELKIRVRTMGKFRKREEILYSTFPAKNYNLECKGCINGLMLILRYHGDDCHLFLFNPSIRKSKVIPPGPPCHGIGGRSEIIIGFDPVINDYKVVMIMFPLGLPDDMTPCSILVYEVGSGVWRSKSCIEALERWGLEEKVFAKGVMHWVTFDRELRPLPKNNTHVVSFNFSSETFSFTELPGDRSNNVDKISCPFLLGDSLAVLDVFVDSLFASRAHVCIWVMNKCGGSEAEAWRKWYHGRIGLDTFAVFLENRYRIKNLTYVASLWKFLLQVDRTIKSFDLGSGKMKNLESYESSYSMYPYVESLLLAEGSDWIPSTTQTVEVNREGHDVDQAAI